MAHARPNEGPRRRAMEFDLEWVVWVILIAWAAIAWAEADLRETERQRRRQ